MISTPIVVLDLTLRGSTVRLTVPAGSSVDVGGVSLIGASAKARRLAEQQTATGSTIRARIPRQWSWPWERRR